MSERQRAMTAPLVAAVSRDAEHRFSKTVVEQITLVAGLGVDGDAHAGVTVQHLSRIARDPSQPNLRQVHLIAAELHDELRASGYQVRPGDLGENITTSGLDLLSLPRGTLLRLGPEAVIEITGLRNPCVQINGFQAGLLKLVLEQDAEGRPVQRAGIMSVVRHGGPVRPGDEIVVQLPDGPHERLDLV